MQLQQNFLSYLLPLFGVLCVLESGVIYPVTYFTPVINVSSDLVKHFCVLHIMQRMYIVYYKIKFIF